MVGGVCTPQGLEPEVITGVPTTGITATTPAAGPEPPMTSFWRMGAQRSSMVRWVAPPALGKTNPSTTDWVCHRGQVKLMPAPVMCTSERPARGAALNSNITRPVASVVPPPVTLPPPSSTSAARGTPCTGRP